MSEELHDLRLEVVERLELVVGVGALDVDDGHVLDLATGLGFEGVLVEGRVV